MFPDHGLDAEAVSARADAAMYRAKLAGGGRLAIHEASMLAAATERFALESDLRHAIDRGQIALEFQPLVSLATRKVVGCEALVRWRHPNRGMIPPATFIPIAEDSFQVVEIDRWVLGEACRAAAAFRSIAPEFRLAVNLSARDLRDPDLCARVAATLAEHDFPARLLTMEVTETAALDDAALPVLKRLRDLGVQLAMDDFGIGYSSLSHLKSLPITMIKIDRTFVRDIGADESDRAIVVSMVNVAKAFGLRVVAEGIETDAQAEFVGALGCDEGQGLRFGAPAVVRGLRIAAAHRAPPAPPRRPPHRLGVARPGAGDRRNPLLSPSGFLHVRDDRSCSASTASARQPSPHPRRRASALAGLEASSSGERGMRLAGEDFDRVVVGVGDEDRAAAAVARIRCHSDALGDRVEHRGFRHAETELELGALRRRRMLEHQRELAEHDADGVAVARRVDPERSR